MNNVLIHVVCLLLYDYRISQKKIIGNRLFLYCPDDSLKTPVLLAFLG
uniref:Uncharacterized protein n=1 Tax=Arundo donax TaxID=35708 RepID=A0A0A9FY25_ARUDO